MQSARDSFAVAAGPEGAPDERRLPQAMDSLAALVATARDLAAGERCIANPVWVAPIRIEIGAPADSARPQRGAALPAGALVVAFHFPLSMSATAGTRACLRPLDSLGNSADPEIELAPAPGWEEEDGVAGARYTVTNADSVAFPARDWDADSHASVPGVKSFVVYLKGPADVHGNVLNDVGRAFAISSSGTPRATGDGVPPTRRK
jgi:hypothetical protein